MIQFHLGISQFQAGYVPPGSIGPRLERGNGRTLGMSGATMSHHRSQYAPYQNPALLSLNTIKYLVNTNIQIRPNYVNLRDIPKTFEDISSIANGYFSIPNFGAYSTIIHNFQNINNFTSGGGTVESNRSGRVRETGVMFGFTIQDFSKKRKESSKKEGLELEKAFSLRRLQGLKSNSLHFGINYGNLTGHINDINILTFNRGGVTDSLTIRSNRSLKTTFFLKPGLLYKSTYNNRFELNIGFTYQYSLKQLSTLDQVFNVSDTVIYNGNRDGLAVLGIQDQITNSGIFHYPDYFKIGVSFSNPYSRDFQWVIESTYEHQFFSNYEDFTLRETVDDYRAGAIGLEGRFKGIVGRIGTKYAFQRNQKTNTGPENSTILEQPPGSEFWQFSFGTTFAAMSNVLVDVSLLQWFGKYPQQNGTIKRNFAEVNFGITFLSAWFKPRDNLTF